MEHFVRLAISLLLAALVVGPIVYAVFDAGSQIAVSRTAQQVGAERARWQDTSMPAAGTIGLSFPKIRTA
jgi:hypothetical protein